MSDQRDAPDVQPSTPLPWHWGNGYDVELPEHGDDYEAAKYADCRLIAANGEDVIPLRVDHYEFIWDTRVGKYVEPTAANRAYIVAAVNAYPSLRAEVARLREALTGVALMLNTELLEYESEPWAQRVRAALRGDQ